MLAVGDFRGRPKALDGLPLVHPQVPWRKRGCHSQVWWLVVNARACRQLSQMSTQTNSTAARNVVASLSTADELCSVAQAVKADAPEAATSSGCRGRIGDVLCLSAQLATLPAAVAARRMTFNALAA